MTNKCAIFWLNQIKDKYIHGGDESFDQLRKQAINEAIKSLENQEIQINNDGWIPVKTREMTAGEIAKLKETCDFFDSDYADFWCYDCPLPNDQQDVLITTRWD